MNSSSFVPAALDPEAYSASNRNEYQKYEKGFWGSRAWLTPKADSLTVIYEPTV
jgi:hypothetical protein